MLSEHHCPQNLAWYSSLAPSGVSLWVYMYVHTESERRAERTQRLKYSFAFLQYQESFEVEFSRKGSMLPPKG